MIAVLTVPTSKCVRNREQGQLKRPVLHEQLLRYMYSPAYPLVARGTEHFVRFCVFSRAVVNIVRTFPVGG